MAGKKLSQARQRQLNNIQKAIVPQLDNVRAGNTVTIPLPKKWSLRVVDQINKRLSRHNMHGHVTRNRDGEQLSIALQQVTQ